MEKVCGSSCQVIKCTVLDLCKHIDFIEHGLKKIERLADFKTRPIPEVIAALREQMKRGVILWMYLVDGKPVSFVATVMSYTFYDEKELWIWLAYGSMKPLWPTVSTYYKELGATKLVANSYNDSKAVERCWRKYGMKTLTIHFEGDL
jgi:hypothetical protein